MQIRADGITPEAFQELKSKLYEDYAIRKIHMQEETIYIDEFYCNTNSVVLREYVEKFLRKNRYKISQVQDGMILAQKERKEDSMATQNPSVRNTEDTVDAQFIRFLRSMIAEQVLDVREKQDNIEKSQAQIQANIEVLKSEISGKNVSITADISRANTEIAKNVKEVGDVKTRLENLVKQIRGISV